MKERFGEFLADGDLGNRFRHEEIQPALAENDSIIFDLAGVTNMTDSFVNACFANLVAESSEQVLSRVRFQNCTEVIQQFIASAISLGLRIAESEGQKSGASE